MRRVTKLQFQGMGEVGDLWRPPSDVSTSAPSAWQWLGAQAVGKGTILTERIVPEASEYLTPEEQARRDSTAAVAAQAAADAKAASEAAAEVTRIRDALNSGRITGTALTPPDLERAKEEADAKKRQADASQSALEELSVGAKLLSALKWAAFPVAAGAILMAFGYKKVGGGALVLGMGLGAVRFLRKPLDTQYSEET